MPSHNLFQEEDIRFQSLEWWCERAGWLLIAVLLILALAGAFGRGSLSHRTADAGPGEVRYERFLRRDSPADLEVTLPTSRDEPRLWIDRAYLKAVGIDSIVPRP